MAIKYTDNALEELKLYIPYMLSLKDEDNKPLFTKKRVLELYRTLYSNIKQSLKSKTSHEDSIFPTKFEFNHKDYKMNVIYDKKHIQFYKVTGEGKKQNIEVESAIHIHHLREKLDKDNIKPLEKGVNLNLLKDFYDVEYEDKVKYDEITNDERDEYNRKKKEIEEKISSSKNKVPDSKSDDKKDSNKDSQSTKEDPRKIWKRRPRKDGHGSTKNYYNVHNSESSISQEQRDELVRNYEESNESLKDIRTLITESNIIPLNVFIKQLVG